MRQRQVLCRWLASMCRHAVYSIGVLACANMRPVALAWLSEAVKLGSWCPCVGNLWNLCCLSCVHSSAQADRIADCRMCAPGRTS